jgi:RNA polymerase sigma-70 factor (ECF subfamily)
MMSPEQQRFNHALVEHLPALRRRARSLCHNEYDAEDLVSDTLLRAMTHSEQFEPGTNLRAWLQRILFHCFVSRHRHGKRQRAAMERFTYECSISEPVLQQGAHELSNRVVLAMAELPAPMQDVVHLVDLCELSYREAAEELQVPVGTVMSRLFRGRNRLATQLSNTMPAAKTSELGVAAA